MNENEVADATDTPDGANNTALATLFALTVWLPYQPLHLYSIL